MRVFNDIGESELSADNSRLSDVPLVVADRAPFTTMEYLNVTFFKWNKFQIWFWT